MTNAELARVLARVGVMLEIDGANSFRVRAYKEGARVVENHGESLAALAGTPGALEAIPGIGKGIAQHIRDLVATGTTEQLTQLSARYPDEVVSFTELQGLGPKRAKTLFDTLGVRSRADLEEAAKEGRLRDLPGFGEKLEQNVLKALATASQWAGRMLLAEAWPHANALAERIGRLRGVKRVELAGSFRRRRETVGDLDLLVSGGDPTQVMQAFTHDESVADVLGLGETKSSVRLRAGLQADLRLVPEDSFGAALMYFTGSKEHNIELRRIAIEKGMSLNEYGLTQGERTVAARTEEEVYRALDLAWVPPELREMRGEVELARDGRLPRLLELADLRADLHMHSTRTDGRDTMDAMVEAAIRRGHEYIAITEHSKAIAMANGFDAARVRESVGELEALRKRHPGIRILHGLEVDILAEGDLDLDDETLALLDWVIVSIHSRLEQPADVATSRALRAVSHPLVHAFGHPTGRMIGSRKPAAFDVERVAEAAAANGVAMEINASPERLDLSDVNARLARERGCRFVINTDAHAVGQLENLQFGVFQARRAGLSKADVWNAREFAEFDAWRRGPRRQVVASAPKAELAREPAKSKPAKGEQAVLEAPMQPAGRPETARPAGRAAAAKLAASGRTSGSVTRPRPTKGTRRKG